MSVDMMVIAYVLGMLTALIIVFVVVYLVFIRPKRRPTSKKDYGAPENYYPTVFEVEDPEEEI